MFWLVIICICGVLRNGAYFLQKPQEAPYKQVLQGKGKIMSALSVVARVIASILAFGFDSRIGVASLLVVGLVRSPDTKSTFGLQLGSSGRIIAEIISVSLGVWGTWNCVWLSSESREIIAITVLCLNWIVPLVHLHQNHNKRQRHGEVFMHHACKDDTHRLSPLTWYFLPHNQEQIAKQKSVNDHFLNALSTNQENIQLPLRRRFISKQLYRSQHSLLHHHPKQIQISSSLRGSIFNWTLNHHVLSSFCDHKNDPAKIIRLGCKTSFCFQRFNILD